MLRLHPTSTGESMTHEYPQLLRRPRSWECQATWGSLAGMLCHVCLSIFEGDPGQESLSSSAREGCQICVILWELHLTTEELVWECRKHAASESFPHGLPNHIQEYHSKRNQVLNPPSAAYSPSWSEVVRSHSQGKLTFLTWN